MTNSQVISGAEKIRLPKTEVHDVQLTDNFLFMLNDNYDIKLRHM